MATADASRATPPAAHCWWQCVVRGPDINHVRLTVVFSERYPDGTQVELTAENAAAQIGDHGVCTAELSADGVRSLLVAPAFARKAPPLWFAEIGEPGPEPATNLVCFTGFDQPPGALLDPFQLSAVPVVSADQLGAVRWYSEMGEIDQIYVSPSWRRSHIGTALLGAAATLGVARDKPRLWGDGQRTLLGEELRNARSWRVRTAELTHLLPPMTPPDERNQWAGDSGAGRGAQARTPFVMTE